VILSRYFYVGKKKRCRLCLQLWLGNHKNYVLLGGRPLKPEETIIKVLLKSPDFGDYVSETRIGGYTGVTIKQEDIVKAAIKVLDEAGLPVAPYSFETFPYETFYSIDDGKSWEKFEYPNKSGGRSSFNWPNDSLT